MKKCFNDVLKVVKQRPVLSLLLLAQIGMIVYYNLFQAQYYMGYDASVTFLQVIETWRQKKLFLDNWLWQTVLGWDTAVPLAALIYGITGNVFFSLGFSNLVFVALFLVILCTIVRKIDTKPTTILLLLNILLTPYIAMSDNANNLQYYFVMYMDFAAYLVKIVIIFFLIYVHNKVHMDSMSRKTVILIAISYSALLWTSISSGYYALIFGIAPMLATYFIQGIIQNKWDLRMLRTGLYLMGCAVACFAGKMICTRYFGFESRDSEAIWTALGQFWDNFKALITGYFYFTGALPFYENVRILDRVGIGYLFRFFLAMTILVGGIVTIGKIVQYVKNNEPINYMTLQLTCAIIINFLLFILCYTTYGSAIFETRYLIIIFVCLAILAAKWLDEVVFYSKNNSCRVLVGLGVCISIFSANAYSHYYIYYSKNDYAAMRAIAAEVNKTDAPVAYVVGEELAVLGRNIRVIDDTHVYRYMNDINTLHGWGDYTYYDDAGDNTGSSVLVCSPEFYQELPSCYTMQYELQSMINGKNIGVYVADRNAIDPSVGISGDYSIDYFYTQGVCRYEQGNFDETGSFVTDGSGGYATWGPYATVPTGTYEFTLYYHTLEESVPSGKRVGEFDVAVNAVPIETTDILSGRTTVTVQVTFDEAHAGGTLEYRTNILEGTKIALERVEIKKIS